MPYLYLEEEERKPQQHRRKNAEQFLSHERSSKTDTTLKLNKLHRDKHNSLHFALCKLTNKRVRLKRLILREDWGNVHNESTRGHWKVHRATRCLGNDGMEMRRETSTGLKHTKIFNSPEKTDALFVQGGHGNNRNYYSVASINYWSWILFKQSCSISMSYKIISGRSTYLSRPW